METENIDLGKYYVRYHPHKEEEAYLAVVTSVLGTGGEVFGLCLISRRGYLQVPREHCTPVLPTMVTNGLVHFNAHNPTFGPGVIASEEVIDGLLYVELYRDGEYSGLVPITDVTLCSA